MQQLYKEQHYDTYSAGAAYTIIGGRSSNVTRMPSYFMDINERYRHNWTRVGRSPKESRKVGGLAAALCSNSSTCKAETDGIGCSMEAGVLRWSQQNVKTWLAECGFQEYEVMPMEQRHGSQHWQGSNGSVV